MWRKKCDPGVHDGDSTNENNEKNGQPQQQPGAINFHSSDEPASVWQHDSRVVDLAMVFMTLKMLWTF